MFTSKIEFVRTATTQHQLINIKKVAKKKNDYLNEYFCCKWVLGGKGNGLLDESKEHPFTLMLG